MLDEDDPRLRYSGLELSAEAIDASIDKIATRVSSGRLYLARMGVSRIADDDSAKRYLRTLRTALDRHDLPWALYDYASERLFAMRMANPRESWKVWDRWKLADLRHRSAKTFGAR